MNFEIDISGCKLLNSPRSVDNRGFFHRIADTEWVDTQEDLKQVSYSHNVEKFTLRGLHFQFSKDSEFKIISVVAGSIYDVILDLRPESKTYLKHQTFVLKESDETALVIAPGIAHGFMTLQADTSLIYSMTSSFSKNNYAGVRWDDPKISINWPANPRSISDQDQSWPLLC
jgi:dTDP-4-dehydrorhamnose 3,5-epimerase